LVDWYRFPASGFVFCCVGVDLACQHADDDSVISDDPGFNLEMLNGGPFSDLEALSNTTQDIDGAPSGL
jgi:hypothetical protein